MNKNQWKALGVVVLIVLAMYALVAIAAQIILG